jgi:putative phosphoribosyl transferase
MNTESFHYRPPFRSRSEAGRLLAAQLRAYANRGDTVVLALPRGGVPVGAEIADVLNLPLQVFAVRKLGVPGREELAMGAVTVGGKTLINRAVTVALHIPEEEIQMEVEQELRELERRERLYGRGQKAPDLKGKLVILTDDGIATGSTMMLAAQVLRAEGAVYIVVAVPVAPAEAIAQLHQVANEVVCLATPEPFAAVGQWYEDFHQVTDHEVCTILDRLFERRRDLKSAV